MSDPWVIVTGDFRRGGGMDRANLEMAEYLLAQGRRVYLVAHAVDRELMTHPLVTVHLVKRPLGSHFLAGPALDRAGRKVARQVLTKWPAARVLVNGGNCRWPDLNWAHYVQHAWTSNNTGAPAWFRWKETIGGYFDRNRERAAFRVARLSIANSEVTRAHLITYLGLDPERVRTIYLGSDPRWSAVTPEEREQARAFYQVREHRPVAVFVGALGHNHRKGFDILFAAWQRLCADPSWDADLFVAGDGRMLPVWQDSVTRAGMQHRIRMLGFCSNVRQLLAAADLLVSPVRYEAYGLNVQEAICRGVPSIVSASAGIAERYPDDLKPMLLSDPESVDGLVETLRLWRHNLDEWRLRFEPLGTRLRGWSWRDAVCAIVEAAQSTGGKPMNSRKQLV
jgi:glycosyltransferase involved in cell wall biosynthesis